MIQTKYTTKINDLSITNQSSKQFLNKNIKQYKNDKLSSRILRRSVQQNFDLQIQISIYKNKIVFVGSIIHNRTQENIVISVKQSAIALKILFQAESTFSFFYQYQYQTIKYVEKKILGKNYLNNHTVLSLFKNVDIACHKIKIFLQIMGISRPKLLKVIQLKNNLIKKIKQIMQKEYLQTQKKKTVTQEINHNDKIVDIIQIKIQKEIDRSNSKTGGFFEICFVENVAVQYKLSQKYYNVSDQYYQNLKTKTSFGKIAAKIYRPKDKSKVSTTHELKKIQNELKIVSRIKNPKYIIQYFVHPKNFKKISNNMIVQNDSSQTQSNFSSLNTQICQVILNESNKTQAQIKKKNTFLTQNIPLYLEYCDYSLHQLIYYNDLMSLQESFFLSLQLIEAIQLLHQSNIVHRDIKPPNLLVNKQLQLKIIDFGESYYINNDLQNSIDQISKGFTMPYSSYQSALRNNQKPNPKNDYWSCGMNIFEIFNKKLPVCYSKMFQADINFGWQKQFTLSIDMMQKHGIRFVYDIINYVSCMMIKINQEQRLDLQRGKMILQQAQSYIEQLCELAHGLAIK